MEGLEEYEDPRWWATDSSATGDMTRRHQETAAHLMATAVFLLEPTWYTGCTTSVSTSTTAVFSIFVLTTLPCSLCDARTCWKGAGRRCEVTAAAGRKAVPWRKALLCRVAAISLPDLSAPALGV